MSDMRPDAQQAINYVGGLTGASEADIIAQREYAMRQQEQYERRQRQEHRLRQRSAALEAAIRCLGAGASDWQNVVKAAKDILAFLEE